MARKITKTIAVAFNNRSSKTVNNTRTDGDSVWLHDNLIIRRNTTTGEIWFTLAGWGTPTTKERINGIVPGVRVYTSKGTHYASGFEHRSDTIEISVNDWINATTGEVATQLPSTVEV